MTPEMLAAFFTGGVGAFTGLSRALSNFNTKLERRFEKIEREIDALENEVIRNYVLKDDFVREMEAVHNKLDRILDYLIKN
tara:strand:+ start:122 stop:364 length:243 start_codon:yes stop_codon:yes gene_type:complete